MNHYYVSNIAGISTPDRNLEVRYHNSAARTISFNTDSPLITTPCNITVSISHTDTHPENKDIDPINHGQTFELLVKHGPVKYGY